MLFDVNKRGDKTPKLEPLKGENDEYLYKGYVPGYIASVSVHPYNYKEGEFAGKAINAIRVTFENIRSENESLRQTIRDFKIVGRIKTENNMVISRTTEDITKNLVEQYEVLKHFYDSFIGTVNYKPLTSYPKEVLEESMDIKFEGELDEYITSWEKFVTFMVDAFNKGKNEKPIFKDAKNPIPIWIRLAVEYQYKTSYEIAKWVETGIIEIIKYNPAGGFYPPALPAIPPSALRLSEKGAKKGNPVMTNIPTPTMGQPVAQQGSPTISPTLQSMLQKAKDLSKEG